MISYVFYKNRTARVKGSYQPPSTIIFLILQLECVTTSEGILILVQSPPGTPCNLIPVNLPLFEHIMH